MGEMPTFRKAKELVEKFQKTGDLAEFVNKVASVAAYFGWVSRASREAFQRHLLRLLEVQICNECGRSVAIGTGCVVDRVPDLNDIETRKENGKPFPEGDFVCAECDANGSEEVNRFG